MALAKMSVAELEDFLRNEFPQAFSGDDITIESADGQTSLCGSATVKKCSGPAEPCRARH